MSRIATSTEKLKRLSLNYLKTRRAKGDLIQINKLIQSTLDITDDLVPNLLSVISKSPLY